MDNTLVIALHGFLGLPEDWNTWRQLNAGHKSFLALNLWTHPQLNSSLTWPAWQQAFIEFAEQQQQAGWRLELWGYSMGGRLALGSLLSAPQLFEKAVIVSANPGLESERERSARRQSDWQWTEKFRQQDWHSLMSEWHSQAVLQEPSSSPIVDKPVHRQEKDFSRERLAESLVHWSLAEQPNYWPQLATSSVPIDWHVGSHDQKYLAIGERAQKGNALIQLKVHANRGHRLLHD